jgi:hypothetical protein
MGQIVLDDEDLVCDNRECSKEVEETYSFSTYHQLAVRDGLVNKCFCKECFVEKENRYRV